MKFTLEQMRTLSKRELLELRRPKSKLDRLTRMENANVQTPPVNPEAPAQDKRPEHANIDPGLVANRKKQQ